MRSTAFAQDRPKSKEECEKLPSLSTGANFFSTASGKPYTTKLSLDCGDAYLVLMHPAAWVYIVTNNPRNTTLYVGHSVDLPVRLWEHRTKRRPRSFTARYNVSSLVYYEEFDCVEDAIRREQFIKRKTRKWKEALINNFNPDWRDLTEDIMRKYSL